jgi:hypothetical protein
MLRMSYVLRFVSICGLVTDSSAYLASVLAPVKVLSVSLFLLDDFRDSKADQTVHPPPPHPRLTIHEYIFRCCCIICSINDLTTIIWGVLLVPFSPVEIHWCFGGIWCLYVQVSRFLLAACFCYCSNLKMETIRSSETSMRTGLFIVTSRKTVIFLVTALRTGNPKTRASFELCKLILP